MRTAILQTVAFLLFFFAVSQRVNAQEKLTPAQQAGHIMKAPNGMAWQETPETWNWPKGTQITYLEGDPTKKGFYTIRLTLPDGYQVMPQWNIAAEHITVIEGDLYMGHGKTFSEEEALKLPVGSFSLVPMKVPFYMFTKDRRAVIQMHGMGPRKIVYSDPTHDPKKKNLPVRR